MYPIKQISTADDKHSQLFLSFTYYSRKIKVYIKYTTIVCIGVIGVSTNKLKIFSVLAFTENYLPQLLFF
jgi:hypothetical protein